MNDERSGQLAAMDYVIPSFAQGMLWLETESDCVRVDGNSGYFNLSAPAPELTLRWGGAQGPALARLRWQPDSLEWRGAVAVGGYVDTLHLTEVSGADYAVGVLSVGTQPLRPHIQPHRPATVRREIPYPFPDFDAGLCDDVEETALTLLVPDDSPLLNMAQDALVSKLRVYCFGHLVEGWDRWFALPTALDALTLFAP